MASVSVGDIVLCTQIVCRLLAAATSGRKDATRDIRELDSVLLSLNLSLAQLCKAAAVISSRNNSLDPDAAHIQQDLGLMVGSCRQTLEDLERTTLKYRDILRLSTPSRDAGSFHTSPQFWFKLQWRRVMWDFKGESLTRYRKKLKTHIEAINLMLNTCIWWAFPHDDTIRRYLLNRPRTTTHRIEIASRLQDQRLEELLHQTHRLNNRVSTLTCDTRPHVVGAFHDVLENRSSYPPFPATSRWRWSTLDLGNTCTQNPRMIKWCCFVKSSSILCPRSHLRSHAQRPAMNTNQTTCVYL